MNTMGDGDITLVNGLCFFLNPAKADLSALQLLLHTDHLQRPEPDGSLVRNHPENLQLS